MQITEYYFPLDSDKRRAYNGFIISAISTDFADDDKHIWQIAINMITKCLFSLILCGSRVILISAENKEMFEMNNMKIKVISLSVAVIMLLGMAAISITAVNAAQVTETTSSDTTEVTQSVPSSDAASSTADSATPDSTVDSTNGAIATGGSTMWIAGVTVLFVVSGVLYLAASRRREKQ